MDKEIIRSLIDKFNHYGWHYTVKTDENLNYSTRSEFLSWNDDKELLTILGPNQETAEVADPNKRGSLISVQYSRIVSIKAIPNLSNIDEWIGDFIEDEELKSNIVDHFRLSTSKEYFIG